MEVLAFLSKQKRQDPRRKLSQILAYPSVRLIDSGGEQLGIMHPTKALDIAEQEGLDLVEVAPNADPPVCRIVDYGKYRYRQQKRDKARKHSQDQKTKEIRFRPAIGEHDYEFKKQHIAEFLRSGHTVKLTIRFKGRERTHSERGGQLLKRMSVDLSDIGKVMSPPKMMGYSMSMVMTPSSGS
jgi:translation initiation factor IF-3